MRVSAVLAAAVTLAAAALGGLPTPASAATYQPCAPGAPAGVDFNGDRTPDAAVGVPGTTIGTAEAAGLVEIRDVSGHISAVKAARPAAGGNFGRALQPADLNGDSCTDLVVGAPFHNLPEAEGAGAVHVLLGTPAGLNHAGMLRPGAGGVPGTPRAFASFGWALGLDRSVLYIGEPCARDEGQEVCAGAVTRLRLTITQDGGVEAAGTRFTESSPLIGDTASGGEEFGSSFASLDGKMAIGAPGEGVGGAVFVVGGTGTAQKLTQDAPGIPGAAEPGDQFGSSLLNHGGSLVIGSPFESIGTAEAAGMVTIVPVESGALRPDLATGYSQNSAGVAGAAEPGDAFGMAVASARGRLLVGSPQETVGDVPGAGMVVEVGTDRGWTMNTPGVPGAAVVDGLFGGGFGSLGTTPLVGAVGVGGFRGLVIVDLGTVSKYWELASPGNEYQEYGHALSSAAG